jgi:diaminopimelate decarboxylase
LYCDGVALERIAAAVGTPVYVYSVAEIVSRYRQFEAAFGRYPHHICYSVKANSNLRLLRVLAQQGAGFDIVSGGELFRVLQAGGRAERTVFSGVGKTTEEMDYALRAGVAMFCCESEGELRVLSERAARMKKLARVALRVNPSVDARTHPYISTGLREHKFGIAMAEAEALYVRAQNWPALRLVGLTCHIGSQITDLAPFEQAISRVVGLANRLQNKGCSVQHLDCGGGLGVAYRPRDESPAIRAYVRTLLNCVRGSRLEVTIEPGRALVANAGILLTKVLNTKMTGRKRFLILDAAMNDLIRPALYGSHHEILPTERRARDSVVADVVGPVCETGDFFARARRMPDLQPGDLVAIMTAGAYGFVLSSNYNARPRPAEVVVAGSKWHLARRRETLKDLIRGEFPD